MRSPIWFALLAVVVAVVPVVAQQPARKDEPKLKVGDPAPPLTVGKWHQGPEVKEFEKGKVYVVLFWGPFTGSPHAVLRSVNALHAKYKDIVPVAVGTSSDSGRNGPSYAKREAELVTTAKPKFTFAFAEDKGDASMKAFGASKSPYSLYVIGKDGKIAFVAPTDDNAGGPKPTDLLPEVLPKVLDGTWKGQKDADALADAEKEFRKATDVTSKQGTINKILELEPAKQNAAMAKVMAEMLAALDDFLKTHPTYASQPRTLRFRASFALASGQKDVAVKAVDAVIADAVARGVVTDLVAVADNIGREHLAGRLSPDLPAEKMVVAIVDAALKIELPPSDLHLYTLLMTSCQMIGNQEKARSLLEKVCADTPAERVEATKKRLTEQFEKQAKEYEQERKKREKK